MRFEALSWKTCLQVSETSHQKVYSGWPVNAAKSWHLCEEALGIILLETNGLSLIFFCAALKHFHCEVGDFPKIGRWTCSIKAACWAPWGRLLSHQRDGFELQLKNAVSLSIMRNAATSWRNLDCVGLKAQNSSTTPIGEPTKLDDVPQWTTVSSRELSETKLSAKQCASTDQHDMLAGASVLVSFRRPVMSLVRLRQ